MSSWPSSKSRNGSASGCGHRDGCDALQAAAAARPADLLESGVPRNVLAHADAGHRDVSRLLAGVLEDDGERDWPRQLLPPERPAGMSRVYAGIDPGLQGACAVLTVHEDGRQDVTVIPTPCDWI